MPSKFLEYAKDKPEWEDVVLLIQENLEQRIKQPNSAPPLSSNLAQKTTQGFEKIIASIKKWVPRRRRPNEEAYKIDLRNYLEVECKFSVKEEPGESRPDLLVNTKFPAELKKNPRLADYDRLFGQLVRHTLAYGTAVAVICDVSRQDQFEEFIANKEKIFDRLGLKVSVIPK